ncbi:MAG: hypothetical protein GY775_19415 [Candidatus Scalindua sp.]|nr:hypothetical protein [Candidatus Scalindua sp.]
MFDLENNTVVIQDKAILLVKEFKAIWNRDKTKTKTTATKEFAYIYFKTDFKSPYRNAYSQEELVDFLKKDLSLSEKWKPCKLIKDAEEKYTDLQTTKELKALIAAETALEQIVKYFNDFKIEKISEEKKAAAIKSMMDNIKNMDEVTSKLSAAKERTAKALTTKKLSGNKRLHKRELPKNKR